MLIQPEHPGALTADEREQLAGCETVIANELRSFTQVGHALAAVRDNRLYRETHATFDRYCREKWQIQRAYAYLLLGAVSAALALFDEIEHAVREGYGQEQILGWLAKLRSTLGNGRSS